MVRKFDLFKMWTFISSILIGFDTLIILFNPTQHSNSNFLAFDLFTINEVEINIKEFYPLSLLESN